MGRGMNDRIGFPDSIAIISQTHGRSADADVLAPNAAHCPGSIRLKRAARTQITTPKGVHANPSAASAKPGRGISHRAETNVFSKSLKLCASSIRTSSRRRAPVGRIRPILNPPVAKSESTALQEPQSNPKATRTATDRRDWATYPELGRRLRSRGGTG